MADDSRCAKCGNIGRFNVVVRHPRINGQWVRIACSRNCGALLVEDGTRELLSHVNGFGVCDWLLTPIFTGKDPSVIIK